jgi:SAM-dependent methyltransferase
VNTGAKLRRAAALLLPPPPPLKSGAHPDPLDPRQPRPNPLEWPADQQRAFASREMGLFRDALHLPAVDDVRAAVIDDLSTFYQVTPDECVRRAVDWEAWSVREWLAADRTTPEGLADFYRTTESWAFDLLWYAYLQTEGYVVPESVIALRFVATRVRRGAHLDFGSGVGVTSQVFGRGGYATDLADISTSLLDFARFRLGRRGDDADYIDLNRQSLPEGRYDVVTAIDTLAHVPDMAATAAQLHRAMRPGGWLITNFDVRPASEENSWHLYQDDLDLRYELQRAGFEPAGRPGQLMAYRRVDPSGRAHALRELRDRLLLTSSWRRVARRTNRRLAVRLRRSRLRLP